MKMWRLGILCVLVLTAVPRPSIAQGPSAINGTVKDTSGAAMPGVTVEAASPALIEKVRSAITDGTGVYRIENLFPGVYTVTFTLPGFSTIKREGLELPSNFTATVNADMKLGALEETVVVTGASPYSTCRRPEKPRSLRRPSSPACSWRRPMSPARRP